MSSPSFLPSLPSPRFFTSFLSLPSLTWTFCHFWSLLPSLLSLPSVYNLLFLSSFNRGSDGKYPLIWMHIGEFRCPFGHKIDPLIYRISNLLTLVSCHNRSNRLYSVSGTGGRQCSSNRPGSNYICRTPGTVRSGAQPTNEAASLFFSKVMSFSG